MTIIAKTYITIDNLPFRSLLVALPINESFPSVFFFFYCKILKAIAENINIKPYKVIVDLEK